MLFQFGKKDDKNIQNQTISRWRQLSLDKSSSNTPPANATSQMVEPELEQDFEFASDPVDSAECSGHWQVGQFSPDTGEYVRVIEQGSNKTAKNNYSDVQDKLKQNSYATKSPYDESKGNPQSVNSIQKLDVSQNAQSCCVISETKNNGISNVQTAKSNNIQNNSIQQSQTLRSQIESRPISPASASSRIADTEVKTAIGHGTLIDGKFSFDAPVRIDGDLSGEVRSTSVLIVGEQASINAKVEVGSLIIFGEVTGDIKVRDLVEIKAGGCLKADIVADRIIIERGGTFNGQYRMC